MKKTTSRPRARSTRRPSAARRRHQRRDVGEVRALEQRPESASGGSSVITGENTLQSRSSTRGGAEAGPSPVRIASRIASSAAAAEVASRAWTTARRRGVLAEAGAGREADSGVDVVLSRRRPPPRARTTRPSARTSMAVHEARHAGRPRAAPARGEVALGRSSRSAGRRARRPSARSARPPRRRQRARSAGRRRAGRARAARARQRERHLASRGSPRAVAQHVDRLAHLERVAGGAAEHLVHVGEQRDAHGRPAPSATSASARPSAARARARA